MGSIEFARRKLLLNIIARYKGWSEPFDVNLIKKLDKLTNEQIVELFEDLKVENENRLCFCAEVVIALHFANAHCDSINASFVGINYIYDTLHLD